MNGVAEGLTTKSVAGGIDVSWGVTSEEHLGPFQVLWRAEGSSGAWARSALLPATTRSYVIPVAASAGIQEVEVESFPYGGTVKAVGSALPETAPSTPSVIYGIDSGVESEDFACVATLAAKAVRLEIAASEIGAEWYSKAVAKYHASGVDVVALVSADGGMISSAQAKRIPQVASLPGVIAIELMNETSQLQQYGESSIGSNYRLRGRAYGILVREVHEALAGSKPLLVQGADMGTSSSVFLDEAFAAVPNLSEYVSAWTIHPYPSQRRAGQVDDYGVPMMERMVAALAKHGDTTTPIAITEIGCPSANGVELSSGFKLTYAEAAEVLEGQIPKLMTAAKGHGISYFLMYQVRDEKPVGATTDWEAYEGALQREGGAKGAYTTLVQEILAGKIAV